MACAYGEKDGKLVCGLSGNPASSLTNFYAVAVPALKKLAGLCSYIPEEIQVTLGADFKKKSPGTRLLRGKLDISDGTVKMMIPKDQGNVVLSSTIGCDVMAVVPGGSGPSRRNDAERIQAMKKVKVEDAVGMTLCHDITAMRDGFKGAEFKRGHVIEEADIPRLLDIGKRTIFVWEEHAGEIHEDDAALRMAKMSAMEGARQSGPSEGKILFFAEPGRHVPGGHRAAAGDQFHRGYHHILSARPLSGQ